MRAIGLNAIGVARLKMDLRAVFRLDVGRVGKPVTGVNPAVKPRGERTSHAVRVFDSYVAVEQFALIRLAVTIGVKEAINIGDAIANSPIADGKNTNWYVQPIDKGTHFSGP